MAVRVREGIESKEVTNRDLDHFLEYKKKPQQHSRSVESAAFMM